ncbi:MAG: hypothetical protein J7L47_00325 [Candidatus Odinarchaeota archaeon]|nr:hypothetical protein [Candidatus Odinarchaeota archaeon]
MSKGRKKLTVELYKEKMGIKTPPKELIQKVQFGNKIKNKLKAAIKETPKTIPEIANETKLEPHVVVWYLMTFWRYRLVEPVEKTEDDYWKYKWVGD